MSHKQLLPIYLIIFWIGCEQNPPLPSSEQCFVDLECTSSLGKPFNRHCEGINSRENSQGASRQDLLNATNAHRTQNPPPEQLHWESIGPNIIASSPDAIGRMISIAIDPNEDNHWLAGSAAGGIFESVDGGANWRSVQGDSDTPLLGIGTIAFHPLDSKIVYAGTGEPYPAVDAYGGLGILISENGGKTWTLLSGTFAGEAITDIIPHPLDLGRFLFSVQTSNLPASQKIVGRKGIFQGLNHGNDFEQVLSDANISDLESNSNNDVIYAGGLDEKDEPTLWRSWDNSDSFERVNTPWSISPNRLTKVMLALSKTNSNVLYVSIGAGRLEGLYKTTNALSDVPTFEKIDTAPTGEKGYCESQCWYSHVIAVSPTNDNILFAGGIYLWKYDGATWTDTGDSADLPRTLHPDQHALSFVKDRIIAANDGGIYESKVDDINKWNFAGHGLDATQFWSGSISEDGKYVLGGAQDNGTSVIRLAEQNPLWEEAIGGDGFDAFAGTPASPDLWIGTTQNTGIFISNNDVFHRVDKGIPADVDRPFVTRVSQCPFDANTVIANLTSGILHSSDLFEQDAGWSFQSAHSAEASETTSLAFSSTDENCRSYAYGTEDGAVHFTVDSGATWQSFTPDGCSGRISDIEFSYYPNQINPNVSEAFFVAYPGFNSDHAVRVTCASTSLNQTSEVRCEGAKTVTSLRFPADFPVLRFEIDPITDTLFAATDSSVWMLKNATSCESDNCKWTNFGVEQGLPNVPVFEVSVAAQARKVVAFTHGRGAYMMDISSL